MLKNDVEGGIRTHALIEEALMEARLTSITSCSCVFNIEYKLYICVYNFCKMKNIIVSGQASTMGRGYGPSTAQRSWGLAQAPLKGSCLGLARQTRYIWSSIHPHDNDGPRLTFFCKKKITVPGRASTTGRGYDSSTARRLCRAGPCNIKWVVPRAGPLDTTHLTIYTSTR
jgi:hypothetical protein